MKSTMGHRGVYQMAEGEFKLTWTLTNVGKEDESLSEEIAQQYAVSS